MSTSKIRILANGRRVTPRGRIGVHTVTVLIITLTTTTGEGGHEAEHSPPSDVQHDDLGNTT